MSKDIKKYHFLVAALIIFKDNKDEAQNIMKVELNTVVEHTTDDIPVVLLGRAQQAAQLRFFKSMNDPDMQIVDVVILNMVRMGHMTTEEFQKGMAGAVQEVKPAANQPIQ